MASYRFTASHGVTFSEDGEESWAKFVYDTEVDGAKVYAFETADAKVAERLRKVDDYGIAEVKAAKPAAK